MENTIPRNLIYPELRCKELNMHVPQDHIYCLHSAWFSLTRDETFLEERARAALAFLIARIGLIAGQKVLIYCSPSYLNAAVKAWGPVIRDAFHIASYYTDMTHARYVIGKGDNEVTFFSDDYLEACKENAGIRGNVAIYIFDRHIPQHRNDSAKWDVRARVTSESPDEANPIFSNRTIEILLTNAKFLNAPEIETIDPK